MEKRRRVRKPLKQAVNREALERHIVTVEAVLSVAMEEMSAVAPKSHAWRLIRVQSLHLALNTLQRELHYLELKEKWK